jgi:hypothetical protein
MNKQMKHTLATAVVVGSIKGVVTALLNTNKDHLHQVEIDAVNQVRFEEATALYSTFDENTTDEQFAEYYRLMEPIK